MAKQNFVGMVISHGKMNKTVKVRVQRLKFNPIISKEVIRFTDFLVHDEANKCKEGDIVRIQYIRPLSARKSFAVTDILKNKGLSWIKYREEAPAKVAAEELQKVAEYKEERLKASGQNGNVTVAEEMENFRKLNALSKKPNRLAEEDKYIEEMKQKYNISWPNETPLYELEIDQVRKRLEELNVKITKKNFSSYASQLLENEPEKANEILISLGKSEPTKLAKNIKKNILMKYFVKNPPAEGDSNSTV